jgi:hypothetical protein
MKKLHYLPYLVLFLLFVGGCKNDTTESQKPQSNTKTSGSYAKSTGNCGNCITGIPDKANCPCGQYVDDIMKNQSTKEYQVSWTSCEDGCNPSNAITKITFCYTDPFDCCKIAMQIENPPPCLPCVFDPMCIFGSIDCQKGNTASFMYRDQQTGVDYAVTFVADPKFKLTCRGADGISYTC